MTSSFRFKDFTIRLTLRRGMRSIVMRWTSHDVLAISAPHGISSRRVEEAVLSLGILSKRPPESSQELPSSFLFDDFTISLRPLSTMSPATVSWRLADESTHSHPVILIEYNSSEPDSPQWREFVMKAIPRSLELVWFDLVYRRAQPLIEKLSLPRRPVVDRGRGSKRLGVCSSRGRILLSSRLALFPPHLRDYVILHELAHLTHLNHSAAFHALVDSYTTALIGRSERQLEAELKAFRPIF